MLTFANALAVAVGAALGAYLSAGGYAGVSLLGSLAATVFGFYTAARLV